MEAKPMTILASYALTVFLLGMIAGIVAFVVALILFLPRL
jgi:hypothetical protein